MAMLRGARFVTAQELAPGRAWDEPKLKSLTGGDPITARHIRQDFFTFDPQFTLIVAGNHKPSFKGVDEAIRRRVNLVPFLQNIPEAERDKELPEKLKAEWPAILRWMIDGCLEWQKYGLNSPKSVRKASDDYLAAEDVLGQWLEERCVISAKIDFTRSSILYSDWRTWCERGGLPPGSSKAFSQRLSERGLEHDRKTAGAGFVGIGLRAEPRHEQDAQQRPNVDDVGYEGCPDKGRKARAHTHQPDTSNKAQPYTSYIDPAEAEGSDDEVEL
jgi:phage/plasmid-associated DNA primase